MIDPPCDFDPCAEDLECIDVTLNGTVWNETYWYDWFATEYWMGPSVNPVRGEVTYFDFYV